MMSEHAFEALDWRAVAMARAASHLGKNFVYRPRVDSTNILARRLMREGAPHGTVVFTDDQTRGRGRLGRSWIVPAGSGLTVSIALRLAIDYPLYVLSPAASLAASDAARSVLGERCTLKWPNDVLVDGLKAGGILVELDRSDDGWTAIVGVGLNVNASPPLPAAACLAAPGQLVAREPLLIHLLDRLESYLDMSGDDPTEVIAEWRQRLDTLGRRVSVQEIGATWEGLAMDVDSEGSLIVQHDDGRIAYVRAGDVTLSSRALT